MALRPNPVPVPNQIPGPSWDDIVQEIISEDDRYLDDLEMVVITLLPDILASSGQSSSYDEHESSSAPPPAPRAPVTSAPAPRYDLLSRKRARSPSRDLTSRELTPCPGPNREPFGHVAKRPRIDLPPTPSSSAETTGEGRDARIRAAIERYQLNVKIAAGELGSDGNPPEYQTAINEIWTRFAGRVTEREVGLMARKFKEHPKMPVAYLQWPEHQKEWLFKLMIRDQAEVERKRMQARAAQKPQWESVLRTHHMKEIDERPRGTNRDRVKLWLSNVTTPF